MLKNLNGSDNIKNAFLNAALDCIVMIDAQNRIVEFNPSAERTFEYKKAEVLGQDMAELLIPSRYREAHRRGMQRFFETGENVVIDRRLELSAIRRDGSEFPIELTVTKMQSDPVMFTAFIRDITDRKRYEESLIRTQEDLEMRIKQRTSELAKSEERFRLMVSAVKDYAIFMLDSDGFVVTWNEGALRLNGYDSNEIIGKHFSIFYPEIDKMNGKPKFELEEAVRTGRFEDEGIRIRKDGSTFWANVIITAVRNSKGELIGFSKVTRDLTARKKYETDLQRMHDDLAIQVKEKTKELTQSRDQLDVILRGIGDGITVLDTNGKFVYANEAGARMCGFASVEEFLNTPTVEVMDRFELRDDSGQLFEEEKLPGRMALRGVENPPEAIIRFRYKTDNEERWAIVKANPIFDEVGRVRLAVSIFKDFTDRKRAEDATKYLDEASRILISSLEYEETLKEIAQLATPRIADWCVIDIFSSKDKELKSIAIANSDPVRARFAANFRKKHPVQWDDSIGAPVVARSGKSQLYSHVTDQMIEIEALTDDHKKMIRELKICSVMIVPLILREKVFGVISFLSSESGRHFTSTDLFYAEELARRASISIENAILFKEAEVEKNKNLLALEKMEKLADAAESANQAKSLFLANMSHEIRTPLGAILGFTEFLNDPNLTQENRAKYTNIIYRNGQLLTQIIDDILDLSKVEAGRLDIEVIGTSIVNLLSDIAAVMNLRAQEKGLEFTITTEPSVPKFIFSDPTRLRQILINLIGNAIKFTEKGRVGVHVKSDGLKHLIFEVSDTGHGIVPEKQERMFEWFTQADSSTTRKFGGTGLGLALSRRLARALGGDIVISESTAAGTKFIVSVATNLQDQIVTTEVTQKPLLYKKIDLSTPLTSSSDVFAGVRVLLVDDSDDNRTLIETILKRKGFEVETAVNGREGVEKALENNDFDIILMDMQMPILDGFEATQELRRSGYRKPILALTAHAMKEEREKTKAAGCDAHLTKPIEVAKLLGMISHYLPNHHQSEITH